MTDSKYRSLWHLQGKQPALIPGSRQETVQEVPQEGVRVMPTQGRQERPPQALAPPGGQRGQSSASSGASEEFKKES